MAINVVAVITAKSGSAATVQQILTELVSSTRKEQGCRSYELSVSGADSNAFVTVESWDSQADLDAHLAGPGVQQALGAAGEHLAAPPAIHPLQPISA